MKKILLAALCLLFAMTVQANRKNYVLKLENGNFVSVEACANGIFRLKISPRENFAESLMERYGIVKSDWTGVDAKISETGSEWALATPEYRIIIDKGTGRIDVEELGGKPAFGGLEFVGASAPEVEALAGVINDKFSSMTVVSNGGIIGDDNGKFSEKDKSESGDPAKSSVLSFSLAPDERIYGGGSTSRDHIQHRGEILRMWATYQHTEIPMPFVMSSRGWGVFDNTTRKCYFDVSCTDKDKMNIYNTSDEADFFIYFGSGMPSILDAYTLTVGRTYVLPKWAYGLCFGPNMREDQWQILRDAVGFREHDVPVDLFWLEPQWMEKRYDFSMDKKWNYNLFSPEPYWLQEEKDKKYYNRLFIGKLNSMGIHLGLWLCEEYDLSLPEEDALAARTGGKVSGQPHWMDHLKQFVNQGVEGFKLDPARTIDEHTYWEYYNGYTDKDMHNLNQVLVLKQCAQMTREHTGKRTWQHYCGGWSGVQHWGASTSGDNGGGKTALYDQLNLGMSGFMNTSCDVMSVPKELEMQSLHFGLFLPWVQINSWFAMMHPFYYSGLEKLKYHDAVRYRYTILPYIYSTALEGAINGMPIVRAMPLVFPDDRNCDDMTYQYMFGPSYCVGIFTNEIYLPEGRWVDAWTGERISSRGETFTREYPSNRAGLLFIRDGAIIPCMEDKEFIGTEPLDTYILRVYPCGESEYTMYEDDGISYAFEDGAIAATRFACRQSEKQVSIIVDPVSGKFEGMPENRTYKFEVKTDSKPRKVLVDGVKINDWSYSDGTLKFNCNGVSVASGLKINISL